MAKKQKIRKAESPQFAPLFEPGRSIASEIPTVVVDSCGKAWVVDPNDGTARPLKFGK